MVKAYTLFGFAAVLFVSQGCGGKKEIAAVPPQSAPPIGAISMKSGETESESSSSPSMPNILKSEEESEQESPQPSSPQQGAGQSMAGGMPPKSGGPPTGQSGGPPTGYGGPPTGYGPPGATGGPPGSGAGGPPPGYGGPPMGYGGPPTGYGAPTDEPESGFGRQGAFGRQEDAAPNSQPGGRNQNRAARPKPLTLKEQSIAAFKSGNPKRAYALMQAHALHVADEEAIDVLKEYRWAPHHKRPQMGVNVAVGVTIKNTSNSSDLSPVGSDDRNGGGGLPGGPGSGGAANLKNKTFAEATGAFGAALAAAFKESHSKGAWAPAFKDYSLTSGRATNGNGGFAGGGFAGGGFPGQGFNNEPQPGGGFGEPEGNPGFAGQQFGNVPVEPTGPEESNPAPGPKTKGGMSSGILKMPQGRGGFAGPDDPAGGPGFGGPGGPGFGGQGQAPVFGANSRLPAGSTPIAPCLIYIGVDETAKLIKKAAQEGYDALIVFDVKVGLNPVLRRVTNDTFISVVQPNLNVKDVKRVCSSKVINNLQALRSKTKGESDGVEEAVERVIKGTEEALSLKEIPTGLTTEILVNKRIPALVKDTETSVIERLSEVNLYYSKGLLDEAQKATAFEQIDGTSGRIIATGSESEKLAAIEKLLEREFK